MCGWSDDFRRRDEPISHEHDVHDYRDFLTRHEGCLGHQEQYANAARARWTHKATAQVG